MSIEGRFARLTAVASMMTIFVVAVPAFAQKIGALTIVDPPGAIDSRAFGINPQGEIVGLYITADNRAHGFLFSGGKYYPIDVKNSVRTNAVAINARGDIVGRYDTADGRAHGYLLRDNVVTTIDVPGAAGFTVATDIDPSGNIVGRYRGTDGRFHGFLFADGIFTTIDYPGAIGIQGMAINPDGVIAGYYVDTSGRFHGFLLNDGEYTTIDPPFAANTGVAGGVLKINPAGDVVGSYTTSSDVPAPCGCAGHGFIYRNGTFTSFDYPGAIITTNAGINPRGDIVGIYIDKAGRLRGFLAPSGTVEGW